MIVNICSNSLCQFFAMTNLKCESGTFTDTLNHNRGDGPVANAKRLKLDGRGRGWYAKTGDGGITRSGYLLVSYAFPIREAPK